MLSETINSIVRESLLDAGLPLHFYLKHLNYCLRGLKQLNFNFPLNIKRIELDVTDYKAVILPSDYVDYVRVAQKMGDKLLDMAHDPNLNLTYVYNTDGSKTTHPKVESTTPESLTASSRHNQYQGFNHGGEFTGGYFGKVPSQTQTFRVDPVNNEIRLANEVETEKITLEYISTGVSVTSANTVIPYAADVLRRYIHKERTLNGNFPQSEKERRKSEYSASVRLFQKQTSTLDYATILRSLRQGQYAAPN